MKRFESAWTTIGATTSPVRARSQPKSRPGKNVARRHGCSTTRCPSGEEDLGPDEARAEPRAEDGRRRAPARVARPRRLHPPPVEELLGQRHHEELHEREEREAASRQPQREARRRRRTARGCGRARRGGAAGARRTPRSRAAKTGKTTRADERARAAAPRPGRAPGARSASPRDGRPCLPRSPRARSRASGSAMNRNAATPARFAARSPVGSTSERAFASARPPIASAQVRTSVARTAPAARRRSGATRARGMCDRHSGGMTRQRIARLSCAHGVRASPGSSTPA